MKQPSHQVNFVIGDCNIISFDYAGFVNPIATGLTEEQMAPALSKKVSKGFENPLFAGRDDKVKLPQTE